MYIIEWLLKKFFPNKLNSEYDYNPLDTENNEPEENCNHEFMPVDSTGETLACIKCGFIVKRKGKKIIEDDSL